jgi:uncharacterized phage protein gp47/JayE
MAYFAPYIDASGLHVPTYQDVEDQLVSNARETFGDDIYLANDSQDFQYIATLALAIYESLLTATFAYNSRSVASAIGVGLDTIVLTNGIIRAGATNSQASANLTGTAFTVITNGQAADTNGNVWTLPETVTLDSDGEASVTVTALNDGPITALANQINIILTPTLGWATITNPGAANVGRGPETDAELKARQKVSVANPSQALTTGILGSVLEVSGVVSAQIYENDTSAPVAEINGVNNPSDFPANSISVVVDGGDNTEIANAIVLRKTPGCFTNGDVAITTVDRYSVVTVIRFTRPTLVGIDVTLTVKALSGYTSAVGDAIKAALVSYLNGLTAGQSVIISELWQAALSADGGSYPTFSLTSLEANKHGSGFTPGTVDIPLNFDEKAETVLAYISLFVV